MATPEANDFLGQGWSFPPAFNAASHEVELTAKEDDVQKSLHILLTTAVGERVMQPKYGCNLDELVFESLDVTTQTILIDKIKTAILYFEPRIDVKRIELNMQNALDGEVLIEVDYQIRATNSRFNFVFPFYVKEGTELNFLTTRVA